MEERAAYNLPSQWAQAHDSAGTERAHQAIARLAAAVSIVPGDVQWALDANDLVPRPLLLLESGHLWRISVGRVEHGGLESPGVAIEYVNLAPSACRLKVAMRWHEDASIGVLQGFWLRSYRLQVLHSEAEPFEVTVEGRQIVQGRFSGDPDLDREELFGRALAAALGWETPGFS